jgi:hypothetical protein
LNRLVARAAGGLAAAGLALISATACSHHAADPADVASAPPGAATDTSGPGSAPGANTSPGAAGASAAAPGGGGAAAPGGGPVVTGAPVSRLCTANDLRMGQQPGGDGAGGQVVVAVAFTNTSSSNCTLSGYPDFSLTGDHGAVAAPVAHDGKGVPAFKTPVAPVDLAPKAAAGFLVIFLNRPTSGDGSCGSATTMSVSVSGGKLTGPVQISLCGSPLNVSPFVPASQLTT